MSWKTIAAPAAAGVVLLGAALTGHDGSDFDTRVPVGPGGSLRVDLELGGGIAFDHGSLHVRSHDAEDVRVVADTTGWGKYAVDLDLSHRDESVTLQGVVDGPFDWMFGGPTVNVSIWVPRDFTVDARISGGPLVLEDLAGPLTANVDDTNLGLYRAEGPVRIVSRAGSVEVEDVEGSLEVRSERGRVDVAGVRGSVRVSTERGSIEVRDVTGPVHVESDGGSIEIDDVRGELQVATDRGRIEADDVEGSVVVSTNRGGIQLEEIDGPVRARSRRGDIEVDFEGDPRGEIETGRGSIDIDVPEGAGFDLDARTERGRIDLDGYTLDEDALEDDEEGDGFDGREGIGREERVARSINGGGETLQLRTARGEIRVSD